MPRVGRTQQRLQVWSLAPHGCHAAVRNDPRHDGRRHWRHVPVRWTGWLVARWSGDDLDAPTIMELTAAARLDRPRWWPGGVAWALWALVVVAIPVAVWLDHLLRQAGRS